MTRVVPAAGRVARPDYAAMVVEREGGAVNAKLATGVFRIRDLLLMRDPSLTYTIAVLREDQSLDSAKWPSSSGL